MHLVEIIKMVRKHLKIGCESTTYETMLKLPRRTWKTTERLNLTKLVTGVTYHLRTNNRSEAKIKDTPETLENTLQQRKNLMRTIQNEC